MLKLQVDQPVQAKLLKQLPEQRDGKYGIENIYTLEINGETVNYSATDNVHNAIQEKVREGMTFELVKRTHKDNPSRTVRWVNVEEPSDEYYEQKTDNASSEMLPMIERMIRDVDALSKDLKYIQGYFTVEKPDVPVDSVSGNDPQIPF